MSVRILRKNPRALDNLSNFFKDNKKIVAAGFPKELTDNVKYPVESNGGAMRVVDVAFINENGSVTQKIPPRPFMKMSVDPIKKMVTDENSKLAKMISGGSLSNRNSQQIIDKYLKLLGEKSASVIKKTITDLKDPENSPVTVAIKGSNNPLIDTGLMRNTVTYIVRKKGD